MIKHIVTFQLSGTPEQRKETAVKFAKALDKLPHTIACLKKIETGVNENPDENWDIVLTAEVDNWNDLETYAKHPDHLAAASIIKDCKANRACVDYEL